MGTHRFVEDTARQNTARRHSCPICRGPMDPGALYCSPFCAALAQLRAEMDEIEMFGQQMQQEPLRRQLGEYLSGLRRAHNLFCGVDPPGGNPVRIANARSGDILLRRTTQVCEFYVVRPGAGGRLVGSEVRGGSLADLKPVTAEHLEIHGWRRVGRFEGTVFMAEHQEVGHA